MSCFNNLLESYVITANSGQYAGKAYYWHPSVSGIIAESITIALAPEFAQVIKYSVEITVGDKVETVTLASAVNGIYSK